MTFECMVETAAILQKRGLSEDRALHYASLIGDTLELDETGKLVILEHGQIIDRITSSAQFRICINADSFDHNQKT